MKKKVSKTITGKSKALKQKVKQVVNVNIHTGKRSAGRTQKPTPKSPVMSPSFNPVIQPSLSSNIDILTLANLLRQPVKPQTSIGIEAKLPLVEPIEINKLAPEEIRQKRIDNLEKDIPPVSDKPKKKQRGKPKTQKEEETNPVIDFINENLVSPVSDKPQKKPRGRPKKETSPPVSAETITQVEEALPALNVVGSETKKNKKNKSQLKIAEAEEDKQSRISDFFSPTNFNEKEK